MSYGEMRSLLLSPIQTKNIWWPNILSFGHLAWCCLIGFGKIWSPSNIRSKSIKPRYYSRVRCALFGSFGRLKQTSLARACVLRCRFWSCATKMAVGSVFDGLFDTVLATSSNTGHVCSINMFDRFRSTNILCFTRAIVNCTAFYRSVFRRNILLV